jgi:hypothetical protein
MPEVNVDQLRDAEEPFAFTFRGTRHVARPVSAEVMRRHVQAAQSPDPTQQLPALRALLRAAYPYRIAYRWRGDPVRMILDELDLASQRAVLTQFFRSLTGALAMPLSTPPSPRPSTSPPTPSVASTAPASISRGS